MGRVSPEQQWGIDQALLTVLGPLMLRPPTPETRRPGGPSERWSCCQ